MFFFLWMYITYKFINYSNNRDKSYRSLYFQAMQFWTESLSQALNGDPAEPYENQTDSKQASQYLSLAFEGLSLEQQRTPQLHLIPHGL